MNREPATNNPHRPAERLTDRGERILKRYSGPAAIPFGSTIIEQGGARLLRREDGWHVLYSDGTEGAEAFSSLELNYPVRVVKAKRPGMYLDRRGRREVERVAKRAQANLVRARVRRERAAYLDSFAATGPIVEATA